MQTGHIGSLQFQRMLEHYKKKQFCILNKTMNFYIARFPRKVTDICSTNLLIIDVEIHNNLSTCLVISLCIDAWEKQSIHLIHVPNQLTGQVIQKIKYEGLKIAALED
ncbi:hypothetical protein ACJX0J_027304, partial [Zea mays]